VETAPIETAPAPVLETADAKATLPSAVTLAGAVVIGGLLTLLYWNTVAGLVTDWWSESSHGLLVPPLVGYIVWLRRRTLAGTPACTDSRGLVLLAFGCALLMFGQFAGEFFISRVSIVVVLAGLIWTFWGMARFQTVGLPLLLLLTMVPVPLLVYNAAALPLQLLASAVATAIAQWAGVVVFREGNVIHLAQVSVGVAEACSGLRSLGSLIVMGLLVGFFLCKRFHSRLLLVLLAIPIAITVNVFRVSGTAILADYDYRLAMGFYHTFSGWLVFLAGMALMIGAAKLIYRWLD
jgi:exosortase